MLRIEIPGRTRLELESLVVDMNGTIAVDGTVPDVVSLRLCKIKEQLNVFLVTADTFGTASELAARLGAKLLLVKPGGREAEQKLDFVRALGAGKSVALGNGANDVLMLREAVLAIAVLGGEGVCSDTVAAADVVVIDPADGLDLLLRPKRLIATLRS